MTAFFKFFSTAKHQMPVWAHRRILEPASSFGTLPASMRTEETQDCLRDELRELFPELRQVTIVQQRLTKTTKKTTTQRRMPR